MTERLHFHFSLSCTGEGNGNPLHCSCLENPRDGEAWWAAIYEVAQSRTRLKRLSSSSSSSSFYLGFPDSSAGKESICNVGNPGSIPGLGRSFAEGIGYPLQYSCLENPHGQSSLVGYSSWGRKESHTTEWHSTAFLFFFPAQIPELVYVITLINEVKNILEKLVWLNMV